MYNSPMAQGLNLYPKPNLSKKKCIEHIGLRGCKEPGLNTDRPATQMRNLMTEACVALSFSCY
jgi:hypothetical protein